MFYRLGDVRRLDCDQVLRRGAAVDSRADVAVYQTRTPIPDETARHASFRYPSLNKPPSPGTNGDVKAHS